MNGLNSISIIEVLKRREKNFIVEFEKDFTYTEYIKKSLGLLDAARTLNGARIKEKVDNITNDDNTKVDISLLNGGYTVDIISDKFANNSITLTDGVFVVHSEKFDSRVIAKIENLRGRIVLFGVFDISRAYIFDEKGNKIFENFINVSPAQNEIEISVKDNKELKSEIQNDSKALVNLKIKGLKLSNNKKLSENIDVEIEDSKDYGKNIPKILPNKIRDNLIELRKSVHYNRLKKRRAKVQIATEYLFKMFELNDL